MYFKYQRSRKQKARTVFINMVFLTVYLLAFNYISENYMDLEHYRENFYMIFIGIEVILGLYMIWLLRNPDQFEIELTATRFRVYHPIFKEWCFDLNPKDIDRIENYVDVNGFTEVRIWTLSGDKHQLCPNYPYGRKKLYEAIKMVNPAVEIPKNPYLHSRRRKKWR